MNPPIGVLTADTLTPVPGTLASRLADADEERFVGRRARAPLLRPALRRRARRRRRARPRPRRHRQEHAAARGRAARREARLHAAPRRGSRPRPGAGRARARARGPAARRAPAAARRHLRAHERRRRLPAPALPAHAARGRARGHRQPHRARSRPGSRAAGSGSCTSSRWPMPAEDAGALVTGTAWTTSGAPTQIVAWADGLAAGAGAGRRRARAPSRAGSPTARRPAGDRARAHPPHHRAELDAAHRGAIAVGALARGVTGELLRDVLPGVDADAADGVAGPLHVRRAAGRGLTLHDLVRRALRAELRLRTPSASASCAAASPTTSTTQAMSGQPGLTIDLADLVENPTIRAGYSVRTAPPTASTTCARRRRRSCAARCCARRKLPSWWEADPRRSSSTRRERVAIARDAEDQLVGYLIAVTPDNAPDCRRRRPAARPAGSSTRAATIPDGNVDHLARRGRLHHRPAGPGASGAGDDEHGGDPALGPAPTRATPTCRSTPRTTAAGDVHHACSAPSTSPSSTSRSPATRSECHIARLRARRPARRCSARRSTASSA